MRAIVHIVSLLTRLGAPNFYRALFDEVEEIESEKVLSLKCMNQEPFGYSVSTR